MKRFLLFQLFLLFLLFQLFQLFSQELGVIEVNENNTATLTFVSNIDFIVIGNNPTDSEGNFLYYDVFRDGNVCVIRGVQKDAPETSLTIKLADSNVWFGKIKFGDNSKILYDFRTNALIETAAAQITEEKFAKEKEQREKEKLKTLYGAKDEYFTLGEIESGVEFQITKMRNDKENTYLILKISNKSGSIYTIDGILFKYIQGKRKGVKKGEARIEERIMPKTIEGNLKVLAYSTEEIGIIMPVFAIGKKGRMEITIREKDGTRNVIINIPGNVMEKVKVFGHENQ